MTEAQFTAIQKQQAKLIVYNPSKPDEVVPYENLIYAVADPTVCELEFLNAERTLLYVVALAPGVTTITASVDADTSSGEFVVHGVMTVTVDQAFNVAVEFELVGGPVPK